MNRVSGDVYHPPDESPDGYPDVELQDQNASSFQVFVTSTVTDFQCKVVGTTILMILAALAFLSFFIVTMYRVYNNQFPS